MQYKACCEIQIRRRQNIIIFLACASEMNKNLIERANFSACTLKFNPILEIGLLDLVGFQ